MQFGQTVRGRARGRVGRTTAPCHGQPCVPFLLVQRYSHTNANNTKLSSDLNNLLIVSLNELGVGGGAGRLWICTVVPRGPRAKIRPTSTSTQNITSFRGLVIFFGASLQEDASGCGWCGYLKEEAWGCWIGTLLIDVLPSSHLRIGSIGPTLPKGAPEHLRSITQQLTDDRESV